MKGTKNPISWQTDGKTRSHGDCDEAPTTEQHQNVGESDAAKLLILQQNANVLIDKSPIFNVSPCFLMRQGIVSSIKLRIYGV